MSSSRTRTQSNHRTAYYEDNRTPLQFSYLFAEKTAECSIFEVTIGKEDSSIKLADNLTNRETYSSIKKVHPETTLEENEFENYTACHLIINGFSIDYIWNKSNPNFDKADYVSISKSSQIADNQQEDPPKSTLSTDNTTTDSSSPEAPPTKKPSVNKPAYLVDYINMTLSDVGLIWGTDYVVVTPNFASNCYYRDNRIPF